MVGWSRVISPKMGRARQNAEPPERVLVLLGRYRMNIPAPAQVPHLLTKASLEGGGMNRQEKFTFVVEQFIRKQGWSPFSPILTKKTSLQWWMLEGKPLQGAKPSPKP